MPDQAGNDDKLRRARDALTVARRQARSRSAGAGSAATVGQLAPGQPAPGQPAPGHRGPAQPVPTQPGTGPEPGDPANGVRDGGSARRPHGGDPQPLAAAIDGLVAERGWELAAATGSVFGRWAQIVGADLAGHTTPESLREGELVIAADSTAWATQLRLLAAQLVRRLNAELGDGTVLRVKVRGPVAPARKPGEWRVRGSRGSRDTYG